MDSTLWEKIRNLTLFLANPTHYTNIHTPSSSTDIPLNVKVQWLVFLFWIWQMLGLKFGTGPRRRKTILGVETKKLKLSYFYWRPDKETSSYAILITGQLTPSCRGSGCGRKSGSSCGHTSMSVHFSSKAFQCCFSWPLQCGFRTIHTHNAPAVTELEFRDSRFQNNNLKMLSCNESLNKSHASPHE